MTEAADPSTIVAYVRKTCTCARGGPLSKPGSSAHEQTCPIWHALPVSGAAWFIVTRVGTSRTEGGTGVCWSCTCSDGDEDRPTCKHINDLFASNIKELDDPIKTLDHLWDLTTSSVIVLTPFGGSILHAVWAANALRADPAGASAAGAAVGTTGVSMPSATSAMPISIYRGPGQPASQPWPKPGQQPPAHQPWVSPSTPRRRWWHAVWPFNKR
jgi:hypothetical protein